MHEGVRTGGVLMVAYIRGPPEPLYGDFVIYVRNMNERSTMAAPVFTRHDLGQTMSAANQNDEFNGAIALTRARAYLDETDGKSDRFHVYLIDVVVSDVVSEFRLSVSRDGEDGLRNWTLNRFGYESVTLVAIGTEHSIDLAVTAGYENAINQALRSYETVDPMDLF